MDNKFPSATEVNIGRRWMTEGRQSTLMSSILHRPLQRLRWRITFGRKPVLFLTVAALIFYCWMLVSGRWQLRGSNINSRGSNASQPSLASGAETADLAAMSAVREMTRFAWRGYATSCLSQSKVGNELAPVSGGCSSNSDSLVGSGNLLTAIDSLDTLALLDLQTEFDEARTFVRNYFDPRNTRSPDVNVFETTIRLLGGLLGAYAVSEDAFFLRMATVLGDGMSGAFSTDKNFVSRVKLFSNITSPGALNPAELGSLYLEFAYLAELTGDDKYLSWVERNQRALLRAASLDGVLPKQLVQSIEPMKLEAASAPFSAGGGTDSYYEYLVKRCIFDLEPKLDCVSTFTRVLDGIMKHLSIQVSKNENGGSYTCITDLNHPKALKTCSMEHLTCFAGGMFALAYLQKPSRTDWLRFAENVTETCYLSYEQSPTKLGPEKFVYNAESKKLDAEIDSNFLRPETIESIFYLHRVTGDPKYRRWGWNILRAFNSSTRTAFGFSGVRAMSSFGTRSQDNLQWSFFIAETLKYLYLLFSPQSKLPLDRWLFSTEAHMMPTRWNPLRQKLAKSRIAKLAIRASTR